MARFGEPDPRFTRVHDEIVRSGTVAAVDVGGPDERVFLDHDLASLAENHLGEVGDPRRLDEETRARWSATATSERETSLAGRSEMETVYWLLDGSERVGTVALATGSLGSPTLRLSSLYVRPDRRRRGIALRLLERLRAALLAEGLQLRLETAWTWQRTVHFYLRRGFWVRMWKRELELILQPGAPPPEIVVGDAEAMLSVTAGGAPVLLARARRRGEVLELDETDPTSHGDGVVRDVAWHATGTLALAIALQGWPLVRSREEAMPLGRRGPPGGARIEDRDLGGVGTSPGVPRADAPHPRARVSELGDAPGAMASRGRRARRMSAPGGPASAAQGAAASSVPPASYDRLMLRLDVGRLGSIGLVAAVVAGCAGVPAPSPAGRRATGVAASPTAPVRGHSTSTAGAPPARRAGAAEVDDRVAPALDARESAVFAELDAAAARELERFRQRHGIGSTAGGAPWRGPGSSEPSVGTSAGAPTGPRLVVRATVGSGAPAGSEHFVARRNGRLRRCYALARGADPTTGTGEVHVDVQRDGAGALRVATRRGSGGPLPDALLACVEEVMRVPVDRDPAGPWALAATLAFDVE